MDVMSKELRYIGKSDELSSSSAEFDQKKRLENVYSRNPTEGDFRSSLKSSVPFVSWGFLRMRLTVWNVSPICRLDALIWILSLSADYISG
jgi:hypothetical protein